MYATGDVRIEASEKASSTAPATAPVFVGVITALIAIGTTVADPRRAGDQAARQRPGDQRHPALITLFFVWRLVADRKLMGDYANGPTFNILAGATVITTSALSVLLLAVTFAGS